MFSLSRVSYFAMVCVALAGFLTPQAVQAATLLVPSQKANIQTAVNDASIGDIIEVESGYNGNENVNVNKANLTIRAVSGAAVQPIVYANGGAVFTIAAPGIIIGGPGQGLIIRQDANTDSCITIDGSLAVGESSTEIRNNTIRGSETPYGIFISPDMMPVTGRASLVVADNTFNKAAGNYSFANGMWFDWSTYSPGDLSAHSMQIDILNNTASDIETYGVYFDEEVYNTIINFLNNSFTCTSNGYSGIFFDDYVWNFSIVTIKNSTFAGQGGGDGFDYPIYCYDVWGLSEFYVIDCTLTNFGDYGIEVDYVENLSKLVIDPTTIAGDGGATYGIYSEIDYGSTGIITNNTITGVSDTGIYINYTYDGSNLLVSGNTINGPNSGMTYGIYTDTEYGSTSTINGNFINNYDYCAIYENYPYYGATYVCTANSATAVAGGGDYGIWVDETYDNSHSTVSNNTISGFSYAGFYYGNGVYQQSSLKIMDNVFTGSTSSVPDYGCLFDDDLYYSSYATVTNNTFTGMNYAGFYMDYDVYYDSYLHILNNTFTAGSGGMDYGIYQYYVEGTFYDTIAWNVSNNTITDYSDYGIYLDDYLEYGASALISNNTVMTTVPNSAYGLHFYDIYEGALLNVLNNNVTGWDYAGIYLGYVEYGARANVVSNIFTADGGGASYGIYTDYPEYGGEQFFDNNTVTGYGNMGGGEYGFYNDYLGYEGGGTSLTNNVFTAHPNGSEYGFYSDDGLEYGAWAIVTNNTFTGFSYEGLYNEDVYDGSTFTLNDNIFMAHSSGADYGFEFYYGADYGSILSINRNTLTGFRTEGILIYDYIEYGSILEIMNNTITGVAAGGEWGIDVYYAVYDGSTAKIMGNTVSNIADQGSEAAAIFTDEIYDGSNMWIVSNNLTCFGGGTSNGIYMNYAPTDGSTATVERNVVTGYTQAALYINDDTADGAIYEVKNNTFTGGEFGIFYDPTYGIYFAVFTVDGNRISGFSVDGVRVSYEVEGARVKIMNNNINGSGAANGGVFFLDQIYDASTVEVMNNCITGVGEGVRVTDVNDISTFHINNNDLSGVTGFHVNNVDADTPPYTVNAQSNFFGGAANTSGAVDATNPLAAAPDSDGDGVLDCDDLCQGTAAGAEIDANGCSCEQLPENDTDGDGVNDCIDNCINVPNADQLDTDGNGIGNACEPIIPVGIPCALCGPGAGALMVMMAPLLLSGWFRRRFIRTLR